MDHWKIFDEIIEEEKIHVDSIDTLGCTHKLTTRMTEYNVCCVDCGLVIFEPEIPYIYYKMLKNKIKKNLSKIKKEEKALRYKNIKSHDVLYKSLTNFLGKEKLYLFYKSKVERLFFFLLSNP